MHRRRVVTSVMLAAVLALAAQPSASALAHVQVRGTDNVSTAIDWSELHDGNAAKVVLARSDSFADALAAGALAGAVRGRFLVTPTNDLDDRVAAEIERLGVQRIVIVGGTAAVSQAVEDELVGLGHQVDRIAGLNRVETAALVASSASDQDGESPLYPSPQYVYLARAFGDGTAGFADSLGGGMVAGTLKRPLLVTATESLSIEVRNYLASQPDLETVGIIGGTAAVSQAIEDELVGMGITVERFAGLSRSGTADALALRNFSSQSGSMVALVDGFHADSWVSGFAAASHTEGTVLLTNGAEIPDDTRAALQRINQNRQGTIPLYCAPQAEAACAEADALVNG